MKELIKKINITEFGSGNASYGIDGLGAMALLNNAMIAGHCVYKHSVSGFRSKEFEFYLKEVMGHGLTQNFLITQENYKFAVLTNENSIVSLDSNGTSFSIQVFSTDGTIGPKIVKMGKNNSEKPKKQGYVFAIVRSGNGLSLSRIGYAGNPLEKKNYSKKVIEDYDFVLKELHSPDPSGRIVILDGRPGTGKTYLVRSILNSVEDAMFVIVPPTMVASLGGPELLPLLVQNRQTYSKTGPTILILEDADQCLAPRASDNIASISSLLNLSDGIFGTLLDIRIVATTNAKSADMDEAIMRPGRLSRRIEVGGLSYDEANSIYQRLVGKKKLTLPSGDGRTIGFESQKKSKTYTLADIYKEARDNGWEPKSKDVKPKIIKSEADDED